MDIRAGIEFVYVKGDFFVLVDLTNVDEKLLLRRLKLKYVWNVSDKNKDSRYLLVYIHHFNFNPKLFIVADHSSMMEQWNYLTFKEMKECLLQGDLCKNRRELRYVTIFMENENNTISYNEWLI